MWNFLTSWVTLCFSRRQQLFANDTDTSNHNTSRRFLVSLFCLIYCKSTKLTTFKSQYKISFFAFLLAVSFYGHVFISSFCLSVCLHPLIQNSDVKHNDPSVIVWSSCPYRSLSCCASRRTSINRCKGTSNAVRLFECSPRLTAYSIV